VAIDTNETVWRIVAFASLLFCFLAVVAVLAFRRKVQMVSAIFPAVVRSATRLARLIITVTSATVFLRGFFVRRSALSTKHPCQCASTLASCSCRSSQPLSLWHRSCGASPDS
jgi:hypothetical protein